MPGFLLHVGATVMCAHGGQAMPTVPNPRLMLMGQPSVTISGPYTIAGCAFPPQAGGPCVTGQWMVGTVRVTSNGQPLVVQSGTAVCTPTGTPLMPVMQQTRVMAS
jgi:hypothetical protein